jgi:hypothetical protein
MEHPPQIGSYEIAHGTRLRFTATAAVTNQPITFANLLDTVLIATSGTAAVDLFDVVKVRRISIWAQAALGTPTTVQLVYATSTGDRAIHTDTSLGVKPAYVSARPAAKSLASFYSVSSTNTVFLVTVPAGSVIDVELSLRTSLGTPVSAANALVGAQLGELYYRGLDGLAIAGTNFPPPVGLTTV